MILTGQYEVYGRKPFLLSFSPPQIPHQRPEICVCMCVSVCEPWHKKLLGLYTMYVMSEGLKLSFPSVCKLIVQVISKEQDEQRKGN